MRFQCPFCNNVIEIPDEYRGYRVACSFCDKRIIAPSSPFEEGCVIGDFVIRAKLGEGAIGAVYKAFQLSLERIVALKILSNKHITEKGLIEFQREARAAAKLIHVNLVQSYAVGEDNGICYMAMTYINGETLKSRIRRTGSIPCDEALHIIQQVAEALHYAWTESHLIHRDVKPDNIMLSENGIVKLTDLGLAMNQAEWRQDMDISGSPSYMSPEQFAGEKLDTRSDIYSLGITLYQMLSGKLPFAGETATSVAQQHFEEEAEPLDKLVPSIPSNVAKLVAKMMEKDADDRFANMEELLKEIWTIRQKTAPAKELVPDVHTISAKRLDYEKQNEQAIKQRNQKPGENTTAAMPRYWLWGLPVILIVLILVAILWDSSESRRTRALEDKLMVFEQLANDPSYPSKKLEEDAANLLEECKTDFKTLPAFRYAPDKINYLLLKRKQQK